MLVRADLFHELGGFDPATFPGADDLDLCWRARLAGRARARRAAAHVPAPPRDRAERSARDARRRRATCGPKSRIRVDSTKSYSGSRSCWVLPTAFVLNVAEALAFLFDRRAGPGGALLAGWFAAFALRVAISARHGRRRSSTARVDDGDVRDLMVHGSARMRMFFTHRLHAGDRIARGLRTGRGLACTSAGAVSGAPPAIAAIVLGVLVRVRLALLLLESRPRSASLRDWPGVGVPLVDVLDARGATTLMGADTRRRRCSGS